jgi:DNA polymerase
MSSVDPTLLAHLKLLDEWGVAGFSRDPEWTARQPVIPVSSPPSSHVGRDFSPARGGSGMLPGTGGIVTPISEAGAGAHLDMIRGDIGECTRCKLHALGRRQIVFGVGNPNAQLMFVGEAPGEDEDRQGLPFVGRAGQLLTKIIEAMGMRRDDVYIANVIKCRPPGNRNPEPDEVATCEPFLFRQIDTIVPRVIVSLGTFATKALLRVNDPISRLRGRTYRYRGVALVPTFHPAFLLRSPQYKRETWEDMKRVLEILREPPASRSEQD